MAKNKNKWAIFCLSLGLGLGPGQDLSGATSVVSKFMAPLEFSFGLASAFHHNPLNLAPAEEARLRYEPDYLPGVTYRDSWEQQLTLSLTYRLRLWRGHTTRLRVSAVQHFFQQIPQRNYHTFTVRLDQWFGRHRRLVVRYDQLPDLFTRGYLAQFPLLPTGAREECYYNRETGSIELRFPFERRVESQWGVEVGREVYNAVFSRFNLQSAEVFTGFNGKLRSCRWRLVSHLGRTFNANHLDDIDRSYWYLKTNFSFTLRPPRVVWPLTINGYWQERRYRSDNAVDPIHAGRYQQEWRLEIFTRWSLGPNLSLEPYWGRRQRRVFSAYPLAEELKSFTRWWGGLRLEYNFIWDMYL